MTVNAGAGGVDAHDWAEILLRMYTRFLDDNDMKYEIEEISSGEEAGIKSGSIRVHNFRAYANLESERGVHRLVRISPFDSNKRRHTSFASVWVYPVVDENINIEILDKDLRIDTYHSSGAGGQHVNTTESAVRITHLPTKIVVQCQNDRSQHKNKESAMKQLRAKLYAHELNKKNEIKTQVESEKSDISWGNQIRSYVLDDSRIKDLRTNFETGNIQSVLDGNLDDFIQESLKRGL